MRQAARRASAFTELSGPLAAASVEQRLWCVEGFAWLHGPGLLARRAQRSFEVWQAAEARAVVHLIPLRRIEATSSARRCVIYAFWTQGTPSLSMDRLMAQAEVFDAATVRREAIRYPGLFPWRGAGRTFGTFTNGQDDVALALSDPGRGRYAFTTHSGFHPSRLAVWARLRGVDYIHPINASLTR